MWASLLTIGRWAKLIFHTMERVLDLGCGTGDSWRKLGVSAENWQVVGMDVMLQRLQEARRKYGDRGWQYVCGRGEKIPLANASVDGALCWLSLPYMNIPEALREIHRVLVAGGWLRATLHPPGFTWREIRQSFPKPKQSLFRVFVLLNGMVLHYSGKVRSVKNLYESCQTERGMRIALRRAGFVETSFQYESGRFHVLARRDETAHETASTVVRAGA